MSDLPIASAAVLTGATLAANDVLPVLDVSASAGSKGSKITVAELFTGRTAKFTGEAWVSGADGDDDSAEIGNPAKPYETPQAAYNAGSRVLHIRGNCGDLAIDSSHSLSLVGVGRNLSIVGSITSKADFHGGISIYGNGRDAIQVASIILTANADSSLTGGVNIMGLSCAGDCRIAAGAGTAGQRGSNTPDGVTAERGTDGNPGGNGVLLVIKDCDVTGTVASLGGAGGDGGAGGTGGADDSGGDGGSGGAGGAPGSIFVQNSVLGGRLSSPEAASGGGGTGGAGGGGPGTDAGPGITYGPGSVSGRWSDIRLATIAGETESYHFCGVDEIWNP